MTPRLSPPDPAPMKPIGPADAGADLAAAAGAAWQSVIGVFPQPTDNFFSLGGDSLNAVRMLSRLRRATGVRVHLRTLLDAPVFGLFCAAAQRAAETRAPDLVVEQEAESHMSDARSPAEGSEGGIMRVSLNQAIRLRMDSSIPAGRARPIDNLAVVLRAGEAIDVDRLERALTRLRDRHEVLRSVFGARDDVHILAMPGRRVDIWQVRHDSEVAAKAELARHAGTLFDYHAAPPWSAIVVHQEAADFLSIVFDHLLVDRESMSVLISDLQALINEDTDASHACGTRIDPAGDYYTWARRQRDDVLPRALQRARARLPEGEPFVPSFEWSAPRESATEPRPTSQRFEIAPAVAATVAATATSLGHTPFELLLFCTAWCLDLMRRPGRFAIVAPTANRVTPGAESMVGWMSSLASIELSPEWSGHLADGLRSVRDALAGALDDAEIPARTIEDAVASDLTTERRPRFYFDVSTESPLALQVEGVGLREVPAAVEPYYFPGASLWLQKSPDSSLALTFAYDSRDLTSRRTAGVFATLACAMTNVADSELSLPSLRQTLQRVLSRHDWAVAGKPYTAGGAE